ncbi:MAG: hypothetical protein ABI852_17810 [Gemmatimonadaceae bacterium]
MALQNTSSIGGIRRLSLAAMTLLALVAPRVIRAQADEIQVYQGGLAAPGVFNLTVHTNFTPNGLKVPAFPGAVTSDHSLNGVPEFAYGVTRWFEAGLYLPLYSVDKHSGFGLDGFKLRTLFARPDGDSHTFVYGVNFEFSYNAKRWDTNRISSEIRPIIGWHLKPFDIIFNPILDTEYDTFKKLEFAPSTRVAYNINSSWQAAIEEYADLGTINRVSPTQSQSHQVFAVVDHGGKVWDIEAGIGAGLTDGSDKLTLKLIVARDLHTRKR